MWPGEKWTASLMYWLTTNETPPGVLTTGIASAPWAMTGVRTATAATAATRMARFMAPSRVVGASPPDATLSAGEGRQGGGDRRVVRLHAARVRLGGAAGDERADILEGQEHPHGRADLPVGGV